tara:strand:- start:282 stop:578 length:297 start_codon:yes stop_codon:yes gene_type:complete
MKLKSEKPKEIKLKINGLMDNPNYEKLKCKCDTTDIEKMHPLKNCLSCYCNIALNSMPRKPFQVIVIDRKGKKEARTINEITIDRTDDGLQMVRGWYY